MLAQQPASTTHLRTEIPAGLVERAPSPRREIAKKALKAANPVEVNYVQSEEEI
jgi:hypothetical protein